MNQERLQEWLARGGAKHPQPRQSKQFIGHKSGAKRRGIPFLFTYDQWLKVWLDSGHFHERGNRRGQYVMARFGDLGSYRVDNVRVCTVAENAADRIKRTMSDMEIATRRHVTRAKAAQRQARYRDRQKEKLAAARELSIESAEEALNAIIVALNEAIAANTTTDPDRKFGLGHKVGLQHALDIVEKIKRG